MSETKACTITEEEVQTLIWSHIRDCGEKDLDERLERLNYLNKRLKAFKEDSPATGQANTPIKDEDITPAKTGW